MDLSVENRRLITTPSGRLAPITAAPLAAGAGAATPSAAPTTQTVAPVPSPIAPGGTTPPPPNPAIERTIPVAMMKLDSQLVQPNAAPQIPWQHMMINLVRLAQPTGVTPGTYGGIQVNAQGQVVGSVASGATLQSPNLESPTLAGTPTAPTPARNDNSTAIATTAWVQGEGFATQTALQALQQAQQTAQQQTQSQIAQVQQQQSSSAANVATLQGQVATLEARLAAANIP